MKTETATPRTDAIAHRGYNESAYIAEMTGLSRQLERELAAKDAHADDIYKAALDLAAKLEEDLEKERAIADRLAESLDKTLSLVAESGDSPADAEIDLAAWKEARRE